MMRYITTILLATLASAVFAQKVKTVEAEYTYSVPENQSLQEARKAALQRAQIQALADEFGTTVGQTNITQIENGNGQSDTRFLSLGSSDVKGEWLETIGEPEYKIGYNQDMLVITCRVKGRAREIVSGDIDYRAKVLKNGTSDNYESDRFMAGDLLYFSFQSPVAGYLAIYMRDVDDDYVSCVLPYRGQETGSVRVNANQRYVFGDANSVSDAERPYVDEYYMRCSRPPIENDEVYIIFSPNQFVKAVDSGDDALLPREVKYDDFQKWLAKSRRRDKDMKLTQKTITIKQ